MQAPEVTVVLNFITEYLKGWSIRLGCIAFFGHFVRFSLFYLVEESQKVATRIDNFFL